MADIFTTNQSTNNDLPGLPKDLRSMIPKPLGLFSTFMYRPKGITLSQQDPDEQILLFLRMDFITNVPWILLTIFLSIIPFFIPMILQIVGFTFFNIPSHFLVIIITFYYLIVIGYALSNYITWFYNIGIVTDKKAIDIDFYDVSFISVGAANLPDIKDVEFIQQGFFQSLFDYGNVAVRIEASGKQFIFERVPRPGDVSNVISALIGERNHAI